MKNIHVLPTEKPSILYAKDGNYKLANSTMAMDWYISSAGYKPHHIYITSDEEIKDGDWVYFPISNEVLKIDNSPFGSSLEIVKTNEDCKKIILTTDRDLIEDGVQDIDDEFLEWFVKNPKCEFVEIGKFHGINTSIAEINYISGDGSLNWKGRNDLRDYKIIIPQEEPKQETLEEAAERYIEEYKWEEEKDPWFDFMEGAKWQAERMYSEEDLKKAFKVNYTPFSATNIGDFDKDWNKWFEQFKKK